VTFVTAIERSVAGMLVCFAIFAAPIDAQTVPGGTFKNDRREFSVQSGQLFWAFRENHYRGIQSSFASFELPPEWCNAIYGKEQGPKLAAQLQTEFRRFPEATENLRISTHASTDVTVDVQEKKLDSRAARNPSPPASGRVSPDVQVFRDEIREASSRGATRRR
jgi:hypothetical protein